jgi:hypothetical protein
MHKRNRNIFVVLVSTAWMASGCAAQPVQELPRTALLPQSSVHVAPPSEAEVSPRPSKIAPPIGDAPRSSPTARDGDAASPTARTAVVAPPSVANAPERSLQRDHKPQNSEVLTDIAVATLIIAGSVAIYKSTGRPCACPSDTMRNGRACGNVSAYMKPGGARPLCYVQDITAGMIKAYRATKAIPTVW